MGYRRIPYAILILLLLLLTFIGGIRYGREVVQKDALISYLLTLTPIPSTAAPAVQYKEYEHKQCRVSFTFPSTLTKQKESSTSATFVINGARVLEVGCGSPNTVKPAEFYMTKHPKTGKEIYIVAGNDLLLLIKNSLKFE